MNSIFENQELYNTLKIFVQSVSKILIENEKSISYGFPNITLINSLSEKIQKTKEFEDSINFLKKDPPIQKLKGKRVNTNLSEFTFPTEENFLLKFLRGIYWDDINYSDQLFQDEYLKLEELLYYWTLSIKEYVYLCHFDCEQDEIIINDELSIIKIEESIKERLALNSSMSYLCNSKSSFIIERKYKTKTSVGSIKIKNSTNSSSTKNLFHLTILALRILKHSSAYTDNTTYMRKSVIVPPEMPIVNSVYFYNDIIVSNDKCELASTEIDEFIQIFNFLINNINNKDHKRFKIASYRLSLGMTERSLEEKVIDYFIGLEALYTPESYNGDLRIRISSRVESLLNKGYFIYDMYNIRSKIIHGKNSKTDNKDVKKLENILRDSLKLWIHDKEIFSKDNLTKIKNIDFKNQTKLST